MRLFESDVPFICTGLSSTATQLPGCVGTVPVKLFSLTFATKLGGKNNFFNSLKN